jgi:hypothetical protein
MTGCRSAALTGPAAAALLGLDGFRDVGWTPLWCAPATVRKQPGLIRTRCWNEPIMLGDVRVAHVSLVLRHLGEVVCDVDRIEFAVEYALREGLVSVNDLRQSHGRSTGDELLRRVMFQRGSEPPAESYAEVRAIQLLRSWGMQCWRQLVIYEHGRIKHRVDLVIPFDQQAQRPERLRPSDGLLVEIDSLEFHVGKFEEDHRRQTTYDLLGFRWTTVTPNQLRDSPQRVRRAIERRLAQGAWA